MILFKKKSDIRACLNAMKQEGRKIGFVPTMGALHPGHLSLIERSREDTSITVCSIFVNPTQFNDPSDFEKYPVTIEKDILFLEAAGCDILFLPAVEEIYPAGEKPEKEHYDFGYLETIFEGKYRPGHFQGVCQVMHRLLDIVKPGNLYLGQKDYQQCMVITRLIEITGLLPLNTIICPTFREPDGLAMSSRNMRLNQEERGKAPAIYKALNYIKDNLHKGNLQAIKQTASANLSANGFRVDYIETADAATLQPVDEWDGKQKLVALAAAFLNEVRLIDNLLI
ncbi:MAG: pantoate--beta-alanine ligase [Bacteroidota bacterium]|nr:pantoate--beta-alanine ligase [Bacteroidota bacterium]